MLELRARLRAEEAVLEEILEVYVLELIRGVAKETLRAGMVAKKRAEDEVPHVLT